jgi:hypothetical protein
VPFGHACALPREWTGNIPAQAKRRTGNAMEI